MLKLPSALKGKVADIGCGRTFGVGIDTDGHVYTWGNTRITDKIDISNIPDEVQNADIVHLAVGDDHAVALDVDGNLYVWGNTRLQQDKFSSDMTKAMKKGENWDIVQLEASNQFSGALSSEGTLYLWGNTNNADIKVKKEYQGNIAKFSSRQRVHGPSEGRAPCVRRLQGLQEPPGPHSRRAGRQEGR